MPQRTDAGRSSVGHMALAALVGTAAIVVSEVRLHAESVNLTTYYSTPRGMFEELQVTRDVILANSPAARVTVDPAPPVGGPLDKMVIDGTIRAQRFIGARIVPPGGIAIFRGACPPGWNPVGAFDGRALVGAAAYGATFDNVLDHGHVLPHGHTTDDPPAAISTLAGDHAHPVTAGGHTHTYPGGFGTSGASSFVNPGMDGGSEDAVWGDHGHTGGFFFNSWAAGGGYVLPNGGDHQHAYDPPPVPGGYGSAPGLNNASSQFPSVNVVYCSSL